MVRPLGEPSRPVGDGTSWRWVWREPTSAVPWEWCRINHRSQHTPDGITYRVWGPLHRLDPHVPSQDGGAQDCPEGRSVLYLASNVLTAVGEVFGQAGVAEVCPNYRISVVRPRSPIDVLDLVSQGTAMAIGALPSLATGDYPRSRTQAWARAIYEDQPAEVKVHGVYYNAAYSNGPALALWGTEERVEVVLDRAGREQDFALTDPRIWPRITTASTRLGMWASAVASCPACP